MSYVGTALPTGAHRTSYAGLAAVELAPAKPRGTVLLLPGFSGSKEDFGPLLPPLAAGGWRVVAVDQRGQYESPGTDDPGDACVESLAADVLALAGALRPERTGGPLHLVGHSFGGLVARRAVLLRPTGFASLVLLGSGPQGLHGPRVEVLALLPALLQAGGMRAIADASAALSPVDSRGQPIPPVTAAFLHTRWVASSGPALLGMAQALTAEPDRVDALRATGVPVLVVHGQADDAWSPEVQRQMAERLGAAYEVVPDSAHSPAVENPAETARALLAFWACPARRA